MAIEIVMPRMGLTMESGTVVAWLKGENEPVSVGEPLLEIETDKSTVEIEAPESGILGRILTPAGETVAVGTVIGCLVAPGEMLQSELQPFSSLDGITGSRQAIQGSGAAQDGSSDGRKKVRASPAARQAARNNNVDLKLIAGTGPGGRIVAWNVIDFASRAATGAAAVKASPLAMRMAEELAVDLKNVHGSGSGGRVTRADVARAVQPVPAAIQESAAEPADAAFERLPLTSRHKRMAERMAGSFASAPHFYLHVEVDARRLAAVRQSLVEKVELQHGVRLTYTDFFVRYSALALRNHPEALRQWTEDGLLQPLGVNIGVAMDTPNGLVVPVIVAADRLGLIEVARRRQDLTERAQSGKLLPDEMELGGFTITNLGMFGIDSFDAVLNPPQAAILAVGRIKERAIVENGAVVAAPMINLSLSVDHRVLDGAAAARFLGDLVEILENPDLAQI